MSTAPSASSVAAPTPRGDSGRRAELAQRRVDEQPGERQAGSTIHPDMRSSTTDANGAAESPVSAPSRVTRNTSPPTVDGRKFPTNRLAR